MRLSVFWFGLLNLQEFSRYLIAGNVGDVGDVGEVYDLLETPLWVKIVSSWSGGP